MQFKQIVKTSIGYQILFPYDKDILAEVKRIPGRTYTSGSWFVPFSSEKILMAFAERNGFYCEGVDNYANEPFDYTIKPMRALQQSIPLKKELFQFQKEGVQYILDHPKCIVGDKPGLGKTAQAIAAVVARKAFPCLIVCPSSLKYNWKEEIEQKWTGHTAEILDNRTMNTWPFLYQCGMADFFIVNYESIKKFFVARIDQSKEQKNGKTTEKFKLNQVHFRKEIEMFKSLVVDEAHRCKEITTQQTKLVRGLSIGKKMVLLLTGTPVVNKPNDLIPLLGILEGIGNGKPFGNVTQFKGRFCKTDRYWQRLQVLLRNNCYYSREKKDVLKQLPDKVRQVVRCDITTRTEYQDAMSDLENYLIEYRKANAMEVRRAMRGEVMVRIGILKNIAARGKLNSVVEYVSDLIDSGEKMILFVHLKDVANHIRNIFPGAVTILGEDSMEDRDAAVKKFQNDPNCRLIICSIKAAGVGLTLTASSNVGFVELPWHGADCEQCEDRAHRIGQKDSVNCIYFLGKDTIDEWIYKVIQDKMKMSATITGEKHKIEQTNFDDVLDLIMANMKK